METLIRSRAARIALALGLVGISLWAFLPYVLSQVSSSAFVNAELVRVTSPIAGRLTFDLPHKGAFVPRAASLPLVESPSPDRRQLAIYEQDQAVAKARIAMALDQLRSLKVNDHQLGERIDSYQKAMLHRLDREMDEAVANIKACGARKIELTKLRNRIVSLAETGYASNQRLEEVQSAYTSALASCEAANARLDRLRSVSSAAKQGIFLQDGYNDTPYSQQQRDRLELRKQELEGDVLRETARLAQLEAEIGREQLRVDRTSNYQLSLPAGHVVWTIMASPGSPVVEGQSIMDLANCERRFVIVELPERAFESVVPGGRAQVRLLGSDTWIEGKVQQVLGSAARQDERLLAAQVAKPEGRRISVEVALPAASLSTQDGRYCDIGRMAEVHFDRKSGGIFAGLSGTLGPLSRWLGLTGESVATTDGVIER
jgi:multidrug resistance efflux pump